MDDREAGELAALRAQVDHLRRWCCMRSEERLVDYLVARARRTAGGELVAPSAVVGSQASIAEQIFCSRTHVAHALTRLARRGIVARRRSVGGVTGYTVFEDAARELMARAEVRATRYGRPLERRPAAGGAGALEAAAPAVERARQE
jgi:DNA-binding FadR family transcriptional regulator